jgi:solute carrier family 25 folate transporter 32
MVHVLRDIYKLEGIRGLYRGLGPTLFGLMPTWAVFFASYNFLQKQLLEGECRWFGQSQ